MEPTFYEPAKLYVCNIADCQEKRGLQISFDKYRVIRICLLNKGKKEKIPVRLRMEKNEHSQ